MSWTGKVKHPSQMLTTGERVEAEVLEVDVENKRISLGIKQLTDNPWNDLEKKYNVGMKVSGKIKSIVEFGVFVDLGEEVDALIHVSDVSWTQKNINLEGKFNVDDEVTAQVISLDKENSKFCLGMKQLEEDPWKRIEERLPVGTVIESSVVRVTDFGAFIELETGIEGLIHISEISEERIEKPEDVVKKDDTVKAMVISVDKEAKKIALSMKAVGREADAVSLKEFGKQEGNKKATLADKLEGFKVDSETE